MYSVLDFLSARIVSPLCRDENEELIVVALVVDVFSNFLSRLSSAVAPPLNALLSSFRERLLTVLPTRFPLP